ncbi:MAG: PP2C family serine/threonine-protein phosphatase [Sedimenticolaceae bacterium]
MKPQLTTIPGKVAKQSLIGDRKTNQDRCILVEGIRCTLLGLADGMGGHPQGEMAAQILIDTCEQVLHSTPQPIRNPGSFLVRLLHKVHDNIIDYGKKQHPPIDPRTTAVVVLIQNDTAYWAHAGDSRFYLLREHKVYERTIDHSYVECLHQQGIISAREQEMHPQRNYVTRCVGGTAVAPNIPIEKQELVPDDVLMLCSDGLWGNLDEGFIEDALFSDMSINEAVSSLAEEATQRGFPDSDNVTLLAIQITDATEKTSSSKQQAIKRADKQTELGRAISNLENAIGIYETDNQQEKE